MDFIPVKPLHCQRWLLLATLLIHFQYYPERTRLNYCGILKAPEGEYIACADSENEVVQRIKEKINTKQVDKDMPDLHPRFYDKEVK